MDWVATAAGRSGRPSVASLSFGGHYLASINTAAANLISSGVTTVVAAGNTNIDAANVSPASTPSVITVGASTITDAKAFYSNYGAVLGVWAPGTQRVDIEITETVSYFLSGSDVISTWNNNGTEMLSGTSMAAPYVAGYAAYLLTLDSSLTPATVASTIESQSLKNVLSGIRKFIDGPTFITLNSLSISIAAGTTNALLNNGL